MSLALLQCKQQVRVPRTSAELQLRIGIHTGSDKEAGPASFVAISFSLTRSDRSASGIGPVD